MSKRKSWAHFSIHILLFPPTEPTHSSFLFPRYLKLFFLHFLFFQRCSRILDWIACALVNPVIPLSLYSQREEYLYVHLAAQSTLLSGTRKTLDSRPRTTSKSTTAVAFSEARETFEEKLMENFLNCLLTWTHIDFALQAEWKIMSSQEVKKVSFDQAKEMKG